MDYDAHNDLMRGISPHRYVYQPEPALRHVWLRAAVMLILICGAGAEFAHLIVVKLAGG